jgi:hypothetical protein
MAGSYNSQANNNLNNIIRQLSQRGIQGGAASGVINNAVDTNQSNLLKMIQAIYQQANQRGGMAADKGIDWQKFQQQMWSQQHQANKIADATKSGQMFNMLKSLTGMGAGALAGMGGSGGGGASGGAAGGLAGSGGLSDWYMKMYGG